MNIKKYCKKITVALSIVLILVSICVPSKTVFAYNLNADHEVNLYYTDPEEIAKIQKTLYQEFKSWGMTDAGASGVIGNMMAESGCDYTRTQSNVPWSSFVKGQTGIGLTQWTYYTRQDELFSVADSLGKQWNTLEVQATQLKNELCEGGGYYIEELFTSDDVNTCSDLFLSQYENPAVYNTTTRRQLAQQVYDSLNGTEAYSFLENGIGNGSDNSSPDESHIEAIKSEWELVGMENLKSKLSELQTDIQLKSRDDLSLSEGYSTQVIGDNIALANQANMLTTARVSIVFIGLCLVFYAVLLLLAYMFDRVNAFIDISLVKIITFGYIEYTDEDLGGRQVGKASSGRLIFLSCALMVIGCLFLSGGVIPFIMQIVFNMLEKFL